MTEESDQLNLIELIKKAVDGYHFGQFEFNSLESLIVWALAYPSSMVFSELASELCNEEVDQNIIKESVEWLSKNNLITYIEDADYIRITDSGTATLTRTTCGRSSYRKVMYDSLDSVKHKILEDLEKIRYVSKKRLGSFLEKMPMPYGSSFDLSLGELGEDGKTLEFTTPKPVTFEPRGLTLLDKGFDEYRKEFLRNWTIHESIKNALVDQNIDFRDFYRGLLYHLFEAAGEMCQAILDEPKFSLPDLVDIIGTRPGSRVREAIRSFFDAPMSEFESKGRYRIAHYLFSLSLMHILQADTARTFVSYLVRADIRTVNMILDTNVLISLISDHHIFSRASRKVLTQVVRGDEHDTNVQLWVTNRTLHELLKVAKAQPEFVERIHPITREKLGEYKNLMSMNALFLELIEGVVCGRFPYLGFVNHIKSKLRWLLKEYDIRLLEKELRSPEPLFDIPTEEGTMLLLNAERELMMNHTVGRLLRPLTDPKIIRDVSPSLLKQPLTQALSDKEVSAKLYRLLEHWQAQALDRFDHKVYLLEAGAILSQHKNETDLQDDSTKCLTFVWSYHKRLRDFQKELRDSGLDYQTCQVIHARQVPTLLHFVHHRSTQEMIKFAVQSENNYYSSLSLAYERNKEIITSVISAFNIDLAEELELMPGRHTSGGEALSTILEEPDSELTVDLIKYLVNRALV